MLVSGALGYGVVLLLQNAGIEHTSVSHAAIIVGALPVVVALVAAGLGNGAASPLTWLGYAVALVGIMLVAKGGGGGATVSGDMLVFASVVMSGIFIAVQPRLLKGRDAAAVTAVQFAAAAGISLPVALLGGGLPHAPATSGPVLAFVALALAGHGPAVLAVRLRPGAGRGRVGGRVREPRAAGRRVRRLGGVLGPGRALADLRRRRRGLGHPGQPAAAGSGRLAATASARNRGGSALVIARALALNRRGAVRFSSPVVGVAQLVELLVVVQAVAGSNPVAHPR